jgi:hypothetical protein
MDVYIENCPGGKRAPGSGHHLYFWVTISSRSLLCGFTLYTPWITSLSFTLRNGIAGPWRCVSHTLLNIAKLLSEVLVCITVWVQISLHPCQHLELLDCNFCQQDWFEILSSTFSLDLLECWGWKYVYGPCQFSFRIICLFSPFDYLPFPSWLVGITLCILIWVFVHRHCNYFWVCACSSLSDNLS